MEKKIDYLIVGQGLAGSILSFSSIMENKKVVVIASQQYKASSEVAAGIINSVVIKRLTKSWRADEFTEYLQEFYPKMESYLKRKLLFKTETLKPVGSDEEEKFWIHRSQTDDMKEYISAEIKKDKLPRALKWDKSGEIYKTYQLQVNPMLDLLKDKLIQNNSFIEEKFDHSLLQFNSDHVQYKNLKARNIIFCEGSHAVGNPFFNFLPFSLNKGEILTIRSDELHLKSVVNKKIFILPLDIENYKIGSSYEWKKIDHKPTDEKKNEIAHKLQEMMTAEFSIKKHEAGIRPATRDRRPFIGRHPAYKNTFIFNGMGAKAALMAPLLAKELIENIEKGKSIDKECSVERYKKLYEIDPLK